MRMNRPFFKRSLTTAASLHTSRCLVSKGRGFSVIYSLLGAA